MNFFKRFDIYGKPVTFYFNESTVHKTPFGGLLSLISFSMMMSVTVYSLFSFLYQKPNVNANIIFFINKKFMELEEMDINGKISMFSSFELINSSLTDEKDKSFEGNKLDKFLNHYRIVLYEKLLVI